jgi:hypothetical protein
MNKVEKLIQNYERQVSLPWDHTLSGPQKVWFAVYDKTDERRLRARVGEFELATKNAGKKWVLHNLTDSFAHWISANEYRESYFESPEDIELALAGFLAHLAEQTQILLNNKANQETVVALLGVATLFGLARVSTLIQKIQSDIPGRLLVFFPGEYDQNTYRLLDDTSRDGWNYLAVPITFHDKIQPT